MKNISLGLRVGGLLLAHVVPVTLLWTGVTRRDWMAFGLMYVVTMFAIGGGLHRYFAHKSYRTSRAFQLVLGLLASCIFGDPIEFAAKHRWHHRFSDTGSDVHSPFRGFWQCWIGHILQACHTEEEMRQLTPDLGRYPELRWLHRYWFVPGLVTVAMFLAAGGYALFACAYCLSFLSALHGSSAVAYFCHRGGHRKYETRDYSSNRPVLVALLLEGWHNNHHHYPAAARAGFAWYEFDPLYWMLKALSWLGIVWDLREPPEALRIARAKPLREAARAVLKNLSSWLQTAGLVLVHLIPLTLFWTGATRRDWMIFGLTYVLVMFTLGGGLHRYFAHKSYRTSRAFQFVLGFLSTCIFADPIEFAAKHRWHHRYSDTPSDVHSPVQGFWQCWMGHILMARHTEPEVLRMAPDLRRYPELMWLHRYGWFVCGLATASLFLVLGGYTTFACAYCLGFLSALHGPAAVNYFCHLGACHPYKTRDASSNRLVLAILFLGEGWHNNHHYYPAAARAGFMWYEIDPIYWMLRALSWLGIVWDVRDVPEAVRKARAKRPEEATCALP